MDLCNPMETPRISTQVREMARTCLRHFPFEMDMRMVAEKCPDIFMTQEQEEQFWIDQHKERKESEMKAKKTAKKQVKKTAKKGKK